MRVVMKRSVQERRRDWDTEHHELVASAQRDLATFKASKSARDDEAKDDEAKDVEAKDVEAKEEDPKEEKSDLKSRREDEERDERRLKRKDLEDRLESLKQLAEAYDDPGPVLECVVWNDGKDWRAVVGGSEDDGIGLPVGKGSELDLSCAPRANFADPRVE